MSTYASVRVIHCEGYSFVKFKGDCYLFHNSYHINVYYRMNNFKFRHFERRYGLWVQGALKGGNIVSSHYYQGTRVNYCLFIV